MQPNQNPTGNAGNRENLSTSREWRAHLTLPQGGVASITHHDQTQIKASIQKLLDSKCRFEKVDDNTEFVFHSNWHDGKQPLGYINSRTVPQQLGVQELVTQRMPERQAA